MPPPNSPEHHFDEEHRLSRASNLRDSDNLPHFDQLSAPNETPTMERHTDGRNLRPAENDNGDNGLEQPDHSSRNGSRDTSSSALPSTAERGERRRQGGDGVALQGDNDDDNSHTSSHLQSRVSFTEFLRQANVISTGLLSTLPQQDGQRPVLSNPFANDDVSAPGPPKQAVATQMDWQALEYVGPYDENLDCPICRSPLVEPEITMCFHIFCRQCLLRTLQSGDRCPIDRSQFQCFQTSSGSVAGRPAPPMVINQLDNLQVRCPNSRCGRVIARSLVEHHYNNECSFTKIPCPDVFCHRRVERRVSGRGECLHQDVSCEHCGTMTTVADLEDHYELECGNIETECEHCHDHIPRNRMAEHVATCNESILECRHRLTGCSFVDKLANVREHERKCLYGMIQRMNRAHREDMESMESVVRDAQERVWKLEAQLAAQPAVPQPQTGVARGPQVPVPVPSAVSAPAHQLQPQPQVQAALPPDPAGSARLQPDVRRSSTPSHDDRVDRMISYIDIFDAKVENLERYVGEAEGRQTQMLLNELGPLKDQLVELRSNMGHISIYMRRLMESFREKAKRPGGLNVGSVSGVNHDDGYVPSPASTPFTAAATTVSPATAMSMTVAMATAQSARQSAASNEPLANEPGVRLPTRRMSDRENPPRL